jgi:hypothetical protein
MERRHGRPQVLHQERRHGIACCLNLDNMRMSFVGSNLQFLDLFFCCQPSKVGDTGILINTILFYDVKCKLIVHVQLIKIYSRTFLALCECMIFVGGSPSCTTQSWMTRRQLK